MKAEEIRKLKVEELRSKVADMRDELMKLRFQQVTGQLTDPSRLRHLRRDIARVETILKENRRRMTGVVTSNKMTKTVVVEITRKYRHPLYKKVVYSSKRVKAHDEIGCQIGDEVQIVESRPLSREKRWTVESVVKRETRTADQGVGE